MKNCPVGKGTDTDWIKRFNDYDAAQSEANGGKGYVGPIPGLGYTPSNIYGWDESYVLKGYLGVYRATKNKDYLDKFIEDVDGMFAQLEDFQGDGFESWWTSAYSIDLIMNGNMEKDSIYYKDSHGAYITDGWYPYPWYGSKGSVYRTDAEKAEGKYSTLVQNSEGEDFVGAYTIIPNYTAGKQYHFKFKAKNKHPDNIGKIMIVRQDTGEAIKEFSFSSTDWESHSVGFKTPDTAGIQIRVYLTNANTDDPNAATYYDEVSLQQFGEFIVHEGMALTAISEFIDLIYHDKNPSKRYQKKAKDYLKVLEKNFVPKWEQYWVEWEKEGKKLGVYKFPFDDTARMTQINEYFPFFEPSKGITLPHNQYAAAGRTLVNLYRVTNKETYLNKVERMGNFFKNSLHKKETDNGSAYVWNYWDNSGKRWDFGYFRYKSEDISHANIELGFAVDLYLIKKVFTEEDMMNFTTTFKELIWQGDYSDPRVSMFVNGSGSKNYSVLISEWVTLSQFNKEVRDISVQLLNRKQDTFGATYGMVLIGNLLRYNPELQV
ncbi:carbohydrate binding domain-containing protein [Pseudalkalibacillus decolorationis]|uniref:carbohydrate binding domain-containing protein n=1 Tax=Pseudalkalibacillus decolorationis TaxID=163879 RepID=UPI002148566D|nr:carbohydrate binding domain-containing protein [Pseudalkalibacillus decolorationis]